MKQLITIYKKEWQEIARNYSWIWVPIVFVLFAIMDPISNYYLPIILEKVDGIPEGMLLELPEISAADAIMMGLAQFSTFGVLIVILLTMGTIAGERKSGITELVLVKPVKLHNYVIAKWLTKLSFFIPAFIFAMLVGWYYVNILYATIPFSDWIMMIIFYSCWIIFVISLAIFFNTIVQAPGLVAGLTLLTLVAMSIFNSIFSNRLPWFPNNLSQHIGVMLHSHHIAPELWGTALITVILSIILLITSCYTLKQKLLFK
ncbi:ABC transporter permease [Amphibacillus sediminis]|uniref:ABC transporter permease n=1 Tax=Amphibacillus sediminis TaxID=360185 RepID=UPI00082D1F52|nr:ABC transporter permease subunit [Amphibacillus sediminis]